MKITEYPQASELATNDVFIVDNPDDGTRHIPQSKLPWGKGGGGSVPATDLEWVSHRNTYRGNFLGNIYTDEQKAMVAAGTFDDLYVGDYWTINNFDWIIADTNYWINTGDQGCTTPHLVIVPKKHLYTTKMNDSNVTTGGYIGSRMYIQNLNNAKSIIYTAFGENNILSHRECFINTVTNGVATGGTWLDSKVDLMNQIMVYGSAIFPGSPGSNVVPFNYTIDKTQLSLFKFRPDLIISEELYWLRDIVSSANFAAVDWNGNANALSASSIKGVRPAFGLIG